VDDGPADADEVPDDAEVAEKAGSSENWISESVPPEPFEQTIAPAVEGADWAHATSAA
jgi:hypothetical protein